MTPRAGVPDAPFGVVGGGRVGRHIGRYLELEGLTVRRWSRRSEDGGPTAAPGEALEGCPVVLLAIPDDAIESFVANTGLADRTLVHFSGRLRTALAHAAHPLYTFGTELYGRDEYRSIPFVCDEDGPGFRALFPDLRNPAWTIRSEERPRYHAACVLGGNFTTLLWAHAFEIFADLGLPPEVAFPFLRRTCANVETLGRDALTGPLARGDRETIRANLAALQPGAWADVYRAFVRTTNPDLLEGE